MCFFKGKREGRNKVVNTDKCIGSAAGINAFSTPLHAGEDKCIQKLSGLIEGTSLNIKFLVIGKRFSAIPLLYVKPGG